MSLDPWEIVGWMIVGGVTGAGIGIILSALGEALNETIAIVGWKPIGMLVAVWSLIAALLFAPAWVGVLVIGFPTGYVLCWVVRRLRNREQEGGGVS